MSKLTVRSLSSDYRSNTALNSNFVAIEAAIENTISRDGTTPNSMSASLDMNSNRIINLGAPSLDNDAARKIDLSNLVIDVDAAIAEAEAYTDTQIATTLLKSNNLSDVSSASAARTSLGLLSAATLAFDTDTTLIANSDSVIPTQKAVKTYIDNNRNSSHLLSPSMACATTANITLSGEQTIDGVLTSASRVLVKNQTTQTQNGVYVSAAGAWTRATDSDASAEVWLALVFVSGGTTQANTQWQNTNATTPTIGSTNITYGQSGGVTTYTAGTGLTLSGTQFTPDFGTAAGKVVQGNDSRLLATIPRSATYAALRAASPAAGFVTVYVCGRAADNDGGEGFFYYDSSDTTTADNDGTVLVSGTKRWKRLCKPPYSVKWFGATGLGVSSDSAAIAAAWAANSYIALTRGETYLIGAKLTIPTGGRLDGNDAKLKLANAVNDHVLQLVDNGNGCYIRDLEIDGNKSNNPTGGCGFTTGVTSATNVELVRVKAHDCKQHGIGPKIITKLSIHDCDGYSNGMTGIGAGDDATDFSITNCRTWSNTGAGVGVGLGRDFVIDSCISWDNGPNGDNFTGYYYLNNNGAISNLISRGGLNNGVHFGGDNMTYTNITITGVTAAYGFVHSSWTGAALVPTSGFSASGISVTGQTVYAAAWIDQTTGSLSGFTSNGSGTSYGLYCYGCVDFSASGIDCKSAGVDGINLEACVDCDLQLGVSSNNGRDGVHLLDCLRCTISGGQLRDNTEYGLREAGTSANTVLRNFSASGNTAGALATLKSGTKFYNLDLDGGFVVASAAVLPINTGAPGRELILVGGSTNITSIPVQFAGQVLTLVFAGALTMTDGSNLKLAGNFVATADDTMSLVSVDGTNWFERSRSVN